jgi:hypothetical protein
LGRAIDESGGDHLANGCTSAFNVRKYIAPWMRYGVTSAAHCTDMDTLPLMQEVETGSVDAEWYRAVSPGTDNKINLNASGTSKRTILGHYEPASGAQACHYGVATGFKCDTIYNTGACWPGMGCAFYATEGGVTSGGYSGGPWFNGNYALGIHKGATFSSLAMRSHFTRINLALNSMGLTLRTETNRREL